MPGYQTTVIGVREASKDALKTALVSRVTDLDAVLQLAPLSFPAGVATASNFIIGDPQVFDASTLFLVCIDGGGKQNALDMEVEWKYTGMPITVSALKHTIYTNIIVYIHPDAIPATDNTWASIKTNTEYQSRFRDRVCDYIRGDIFETGSGSPGNYVAPPGVDLTLASKEMSAGGDNLTSGRVASIDAGRFNHQIGDTWGVVGANIRVEHILN